MERTIKASGDLRGVGIEEMPDPVGLLHRADEEPVGGGQVGAGEHVIIPPGFAGHANLESVWSNATEVQNV